MQSSKLFLLSGTDKNKKRFKATFFFPFFGRSKRTFLIWRKNLFMCINVKTGAKRLEIKEYIEIMKNGVRYIVIDQYRS